MRQSLNLLANCYMRPGEQLEEITYECFESSWFSSFAQTHSCVR